MKQLAFDFPHRPAYGAADFLVAPANETAISWLDRWPDWPHPAMLFHGPAGCGKTHLAHVWQKRSNALFHTGAELTAERVPVFGAAVALVLDDAAAAAERPLLHLFNLIAENRGHLLLTAREPPARWEIALPDLRSRLLATPTIAVAPPDDALIGAVLIKLFADRQVVVGEDVVLFLLRHMERSFAAASRIVAALDRLSLLAQRPITVPLARQILDDEGEREDVS